MGAVRETAAAEAEARRAVRDYARLVKLAADGLASEPASEASATELERYSRTLIHWAGLARSAREKSEAAAPAAQGIDTGQGDL